VFPSVTHAVLPIKATDVGVEKLPYIGVTANPLSLITTRSNVPAPSTKRKLLSPIVRHGWNLIKSCRKSGTRVCPEALRALNFAGTQQLRLPCEYRTGSAGMVEQDLRDFSEPLCARPITL